MKSMPYRQFLDRNSVELSDLMIAFHELNYCYDYQMILTVDNSSWELYDLRVSKPLVRLPFKKIRDMRLYITGLLHDISCVRLIDSVYRGRRKLKRTEVYSFRRIINLYGYDDYFITNQKLINYLLYGNLERNP